MRLRGYKPQWLIDNVFAGDGLCELEDAYGEYETCGCEEDGCEDCAYDAGRETINPSTISPSATWDAIYEYKADDLDCWDDDEDGAFSERYGANARPAMICKRGCDWGSGIGRGLGITHPTVVDGHHRIVRAHRDGDRYVRVIVFDEWQECKTTVGHSHGCPGCSRCSTPQEASADPRLPAWAA